MPKPATTTAWCNLAQQSFSIPYDLKYIYSENQNNGKILQQLQTVGGETTNYTYDSLNRLATASTGALGTELHV